MRLERWMSALRIEFSLSDPLKLSATLHDVNETLQFAAAVNLRSLEERARIARVRLRIGDDFREPSVWTFATGLSRQEASIKIPLAFTEDADR